MELVPENRKFVFKNLCPYCHGNLTYEVSGFEKDDQDRWKAEVIEPHCSNEPEMENEFEWNDWFSMHSDMPYVRQMPVDQKVLEYINSKYHFNLG